VDFPVLQVLDLVEQHPQASLWWMAMQVDEQAQQALERVPRVQRRVDRQEEQLHAGHAVLQQTLQELLEHDGLADPARPDQDHGTPHGSLGNQAQEAREVGPPRP
jgi:hypothetical protein